VAQYLPLGCTVFGGVGSVRHNLTGLPSQKTILDRLEKLAEPYSRHSPTNVIN